MDLAHERRGTGEPLVLLHAYGLTWRSYEPVLDLLAEHHDVIAVDLPGFGTSPPLPRGTRYTLPALCDAVETFCARLELDRPHVAGNSLGGLMALNLACRGTVRTATAIAPPGFFSMAGLVRTGSMLVPGALAARLPHPIRSRALRSPHVRALVHGMMSARPGSVPDDELLALLAAVSGAPGALPLIPGLLPHVFFHGQPKVPVTLVWPSRDRILARRHAHRARQMIPDARHVWLPLCGHVPMYDDPVRVTEAILEGARNTFQIGTHGQRSGGAFRQTNAADTG